MNKELTYTEAVAHVTTHKWACYACIPKMEGEREIGVRCYIIVPYIPQEGDHPYTIEYQAGRYGTDEGAIEQFHIEDDLPDEARHMTYHISATKSASWGDLPIAEMIALLRGNP